MTNNPEELHTVSFAARRLKLHPVTILRFIREGRLAATKIGKSYRILQSELERVAGEPARSERPPPKFQVTSIVDIDGINQERALRLASMTTAALNGRLPGGTPLRVDVIHDPTASHLKIVLVGAPQDTGSMLALLQIWLDAK
jgi:excisionase family DNA binding protein